jgi:DNA invertase Pin-like site-specific DNA recombinase
MKRKRLKTKNPTVAVGYIRVSTGRQVESGLGLRDQKLKIQEYCKLRGYKLKTVLADGISAAKMPIRGREGGSQLFGMIDRGEVGAVVSLKLDRLFRRTVDALDTVDHWDSKGVSLHLIDFGGNTVDTSTAVGRMFLTMLAGFSQFESDLISERTTAALAIKREQGRITGTIPYGYQDNGQGYLEESPVEYPVLQKIISLYHGGDKAWRIKKKLDQDEISTRNGKPFEVMVIHRILKRYEEGFYHR